MAELSEDVKKALRIFVERLHGLMQGTSNDCLQCGENVAYAEKIGNSVYAYPCGCRMYQGDVPEHIKKRQSG